jgi:hypothetical protein
MLKTQIDGQIWTKQKKEVSLLLPLVTVSQLPKPQVWIYLLRNCFAACLL